MLILLSLFACGKSATPEEREQRYVDALVEDVSVYKPNQIGRAHV